MFHDLKSTWEARLARLLGQTSRSKGQNEFALLVPLDPQSTP